MTNSSDILVVTADGPVATLTMNRPAKRNAMCDELLEALEAFFTSPPEGSGRLS
jgi:enoyl-CoA hydratase/carnithine racemase